MAVSILLAIALFGTLSAADKCQSDMNDRCLSKSEVGGLSVHMQAGDPCFLYSGSRYCFVSTDGMMYPCTCTAECGCQDADTVKPPPKCDNSAVPETFVKQCGEGYGDQNTMCVYSGMGAQCGDKVCMVGLTKEEKEKVVKKHNELRRKVAKGQETLGQPGPQPPAANMNELIWDEELALTAQRWADQCLGGHDEDDARVTPKFKSVGQNYAMTSSSANTADNDVEKYVQMWYDEVKDMAPSTVKNFQTGSPNTGVIGHYTAVVWAKTKYVGCGFIYYKTSDGWYQREMVCNYSEAANLLGAEVYEEGTAGSKCTKNNDGLCA